MRCFFALLPLLGVALVGAQNYGYGSQYNNQNNQNNNLQNVQNPNNRNQNGQMANLNGQSYAGQNPAVVQNPYNNAQTQFQNYQSQQYQNQNGQQQQQPIQRPSGFLNAAPINSFPGGDPNQQNQTGAVIVLQLKSYSNPSLKLPGGMTCSCPQGLQCPYLRATGPQCWFSFTTIISAPDMSVQYIATEFVPLDYNGNVDLTRTTANWTAPQTLYLSSKPSAIDIFVHHLGLVINQQTAALQFYNNLVHVDTFIQPLNNYLPSITSQTPVTSSVTLTGQITQTSLSIVYSVQCRNNYVGPNCDLTCTPSASNSQNAVCYSNVTGFYSVCSYQAGQQVSNCQPCQNGVNNGQCTGNVVMTGQTVTTSSFRTWTIVLGCLLGLALLFIVALIVFIILSRNREPAPAYRAPPPPTNTWSKSAAARPLLSDPYPSKAEQNSQDWGYQPHVVSVNNQRSAPLADHEASRHSQSTNDDQNSHSSYTNNRPANGNPVALARREAQV